MAIESERLAQTSGHNNNCAFYSFIPVFLKHLLNGDLDRLLTTSAYVTLLNTFREYYGLNESLTWDDVKTLSTVHTNPIDRELLWGNIFRFYLGTMLTNLQLNATHVDNLREAIFESIIRKFLNEDHLEPTEFNVATTNINYLRTLRENYQSSDQTLDVFMLNQSVDIAEYWRDNGYQNYCTGVATRSLQISSEELSCITSPLGFNLRAHKKVSVPNRERTPTIEFPLALSKDVEDNIATIEFVEVGNHWEVQMPTREEAQRHNRARREQPKTLPSNNEERKQIIQVEFTSLKTNPEERLIVEPLAPTPDSTKEKFTKASSLAEWNRQDKNYRKSNEILNQLIDSGNMKDFELYFNRLQKAIETEHDSEIKRISTEIKEVSPDEAPRSMMRV